MALGKKELDARFALNHVDDELRKAARAFAGKIDKLVPDGRHKSLAITGVEDALLRSHAGQVLDGASAPAQAAAAETPEPASA